MSGKGFRTGASHTAMWGSPATTTSRSAPADRADVFLMLDRNSARMRRDYETAAIMVAALRSTLSHLKARQSVAVI